MSTNEYCVEIVCGRIHG